MSSKQTETPATPTPAQVKPVYPDQATPQTSLGKFVGVFDGLKELAKVHEPRPE